MKNDTERLQWLISLSEKNLDEMPEWEWPKIKAELVQYLYPWAERSVIEVFLQSKELKGQLNKATLVETQDELRKALEALTWATAHTMSLPIDHMPIYQHEIQLDITLKLIQGITEEAEFRIQYGGPLKSRVFMALSQILANGLIKPPQLRLCPECKRIFLLRRKPDPKKQYFCSSRCSSKASSRAYYQKLKGEKAEEVKSKKREKSHRQYKEKIRKKYGPNVRVARRPRRARGA